jgi:uncharacterized membrane protein
MLLSKRHIAKTLSWRLIGTIDTFFFAWLITGEIGQSINISGISTFTKLIWYYFHEKFWFESEIQNPKKRHIIKTFSWRGFATIDTLIVSWLFLGNPFTGMKIGIAETFTKMILYYLHEKVWYKINFGLDKRNNLKTEEIKLKQNG